MSSWHAQLCERLTTLLHLLRVVFGVVRRRAVQACAVTAYRVQQGRFRASEILHASSCKPCTFRDCTQECHRAETASTAAVGPAKQ